MSHRRGPITEHLYPEDIPTSTPLIPQKEAFKKTVSMETKDFLPLSQERSYHLKQDSLESLRPKWKIWVPQRWNRSRKGQHQGWKPITIGSAVLGGFIAISLSMIVLLEVLFHISKRPENGGGLAFAADVNELSALASFGYLYLPTILAVFYSMMWRHWSVFYACLISLMIIYIITPLQSAIFNTGTITRSMPAMMGSSAALVSLSSQTTDLTTNFMDTAYAIAWLDEQVPPYTTSDFAFLPFQPVDISSTDKLPSERWVTTVDAFYTNLTCSPALVEVGSSSYTFSNGKGCVVPDISFIPATGSYMVAYISWYDDPQSDWALQNPNCTAEFSNNFLAVWAANQNFVGDNIYSNLTAVFCETSYTSQIMRVTVNASSHAIQDFTIDQENNSAAELVDVFNITNFEYLIGTGVPSSTLSLNYPDETILQQDARIKDLSITWPTSNIVGFAAGLTQSPIASWSEPDILGRAFEKAHQILLVTALSTLTEASSDMQTVRVGERQDDPGAIILVRSISLIVEVAFGIIIVLIICLWYLCRKRPSKLGCDPASIADIMSMVHYDGELSADTHDGDGRLTMLQLEHALAQKRYKLLEQGSSSSILRRFSSDNLRGLHLSHSLHISKSSQKDKALYGVRPIELSLVVGSAVISALFLAIVGIIFLNIWSARGNGIQLPTDNSVVRSIIENYAPTAFATFVDPIWSILNRLLCLLQPFEELRKGNATASRSLNVKYTSLPPQLAFWRALRARNFLLAIVCIMAVSTNVLAVALAALLVEGSTNVEIPFESAPQFSPQFNGSGIISKSVLSVDYFDHFYIVISNVSHGNSLPPWIDQKNFYIPFAIDSKITTSSPVAELQSYRGVTTGFGASVTCAAATSSGKTDQLLFNVSSDGTIVQFSTSHIFPNGTETSCFGPQTVSVISYEGTSNQTLYTLSPFTDGASALEVAQWMIPSTSDDGFCSSTATMGWVRVSEGTTLPSSNDSESAGRSVNQTFLTCTQSLLVAQHEVIVDSTGRILRSERASDFATDLSPYFSPNATSEDPKNNPIIIRTQMELFQQATNEILPFNSQGDFQWHNNSLTSDWINSLLGLILNSTELVDPSMPVPDPTYIGPVVEDLYSQLFAILLGLNPHVFAPASTSMNAYAIYTETRIFVSPLMFKISITILSLQLIVAIMLYANRPMRFLPRMPTSIASIIAFVAASRALEDFNGDKESRDDEDREKDAEKDGEERRYGYGRFVGTDGRTKVGIEKQRFVVPLEVRNPHVKRRRWWLRMGKGGEGEVKSWI